MVVRASVFRLRACKKSLHILEFLLPSPTSYSFFRSSARKQVRRKSKARISYGTLESRQLLAAIISEFVASNSSGIVDDNGRTSDWIVIYNTSDQPINLAGYSLTDNANDPARYVFPSQTLAGQSYFVIYAADDADPNSGGDLYTGFGLSSAGEYLGLYDVTGNVASEFATGGGDYPTQYSDVSYGVESNGGFDQVSYFTTPTPGAANVDSVAGIAERVQASVAAGFYENSFQVALSTPTPCLLYTSPSPRDRQKSRMPSSA